MKNRYIVLVSILSIIVLIVSYSQWNKKIEAVSNIKITPPVETEVATDEVNYYKEDRGDLTYAAIGDSLTIGYYASNESHRFVDVFSSKLEKDMGYDVKTHVVGGYGKTLSSALEAIPEIQELQPDLVTIEFGTNDSNSDNNVPIDLFKSDLNKLIQGVKKDNEKVKIVLVTTWSLSDNATLFNEAIQSVGESKDIPVADIKPLRGNIENTGPADIQTEYGISDTFHPNDKGHEAIANTIFESAKDPLNN